MKKQIRGDMKLYGSIDAALEELHTPGNVHDRLKFYVIWHSSPNHSDGYYEWVITLFIVVNGIPKNLNNLLYDLGYDRNKYGQIKTPGGLDTTRDRLLQYLYNVYAYSRDISMVEF